MIDASVGSALLSSFVKQRCLFHADSQDTVKLRYRVLMNFVLQQQLREISEIKYIPFESTSVPCAVAVAIAAFRMLLRCNQRRLMATLCAIRDDDLSVDEQVLVAQVLMRGLALGTYGVPAYRCSRYAGALQLPLKRSAFGILARHFGQRCF